MTAKKRWFCKQYSDSQDTNESNADISWSSSGSDSDSEPEIKKLKVNKSPGWIKLIKTPGSNSVSSNSNLEKVSDTKTRQPITSPSTHNSLEISAISNLQEYSPDLPRSNDIKEQSPIIGRKNILKKMKSLLKSNCRSKILEIVDNSLNSSELFSSQSSLVVIDSKSPVNLESISTISPTNSLKSPLCDIDPVRTQEISQIDIVTTTDSSANSDPRLLLYHQPPPKKKRFKKGGLASQLEKALNLQKSSLTIWQHELYINKSKNCVPSASDENGSSIEFCIKNSWKEYGCTVLDCEYIKSDDASLKFPENNLFLLIVGFNVVPNVSFSPGSFYKLLLPYEIKTITYKSKQTVCYYNASKFVLSK